MYCLCIHTLGFILVGLRDAELQQVNELLRKSGKVHQQALLSLQSVSRERGGREWETDDEVCGVTVYGCVCVCVGG